MGWGEVEPTHCCSCRNSISIFKPQWNEPVVCGRKRNVRKTAAACAAWLSPRSSDRNLKRFLNANFFYQNNIVATQNIQEFVALNRLVIPSLCTATFPFFAFAVQKKRNLLVSRRGLSNSSTGRSPQRTTCIPFGWAHCRCDLVLLTFHSRLGAVMV